MNEIIIFINKMKTVFNLISDEEIDTYNNLYNDYPTEDFINWINEKYNEIKFDKLKNF